MANLQINSSPPAIGLIGEGLKYEIERTGGGITGFAEVLFILPNSSGNYLNKYMELNTYGGILKFYFKAIPDETGLELRTWDLTGPDTYSEFLDKVCEDLAANYLINEYYKVVVTTTGFKLTAREVGEAYDAELEDTDVTSLTEGTNTGGIDDITPSDYNIYIAPLLPSDPVEALNTPIGEDLIPINSDSIVFADVSEYLKDLLSSTFTFPYNGSLINEVTDAIIQYYIRYAEYKDSNVQKLYNTYSSKLYAIAGKLKQIDSDFFNSEGSNYMDYMDNSMRFLTWAPLSKVTYPNMPERLFYLTQSSQLTLMVTANYSNISIDTELQLITADAYTVIEILCGLPEIFTDQDISDLISYDIWIKDSKNDVVSELRNFIVDHNTYLNIRTLIFKNSFGMFDVLNCTGDLTISDNVKRTEIEVLTNLVFRRNIQLAENTASYSLSSGWLNNKHSRLWLEELLLSKVAYLALGDFILPIIITSGKTTRFADREHNYSLNITFNPDFREEAYSSIVGDGAYFYTDEDHVIYTDENGVKLIE